MGVHTVGMLAAHLEHMRASTPTERVNISSSSSHIVTLRRELTDRSASRSRSDQSESRVVKLLKVSFAWDRTDNIVYATNVDGERELSG